MNEKEIEQEAENACVLNDVIHRDCFVAGYATAAKRYLKDYEETEALLDKQIEATFKLDRENKALKKRLKKIELLCYSDGNDGEILGEIMKYFSKADK